MWLRQLIPLIVIICIAQAADAWYTISGNGSIQATNGTLYDFYAPAVYVECNLTAQVLYPEANDTFYMPNISPNVTYAIGNASNLTTCAYRIYSLGAWHGWNGLNCSEGNNTEVITLPEGWPITLEIQATDGVCQTSAYQDVKVVYGRGNAATTGLSWILVLPIVLLILLFYFLDDEENRSRRKHGR